MWDVLLIVFSLGAAWAGYRKGFFASLSTIIALLLGIFFGGMLGHALYPPHSTAEVVLGRLGGITIIVIVSGVILGLLAKWLNKYIPETWDKQNAWAGAILRGLVVAFIICTTWAVVHSIPSYLLPSKAQILKTSSPLTAWIAENTGAANLASQAPRLVPIPSLQTPIDLPPDNASDTVQIAAAAANVVPIHAYGCPGRSNTGSAWPISEHILVTAAHVVQGTNRVTVQTATGVHRARVVSFDEKRDLALLRTSSTLTPLPITTAKPGDLGAVVGYPGGGSQQIGPARAGATLQLWVPIQDNTDVAQRNVLSLRSTVLPGDSGGAAIGRNGRVWGTIFASGRAASTYVVPASEVAKMKVERNAPTGECLQLDPSTTLLGGE